MPAHRIVWLMLEPNFSHRISRQWIINGPPETKKPLRSKIRPVLPVIYPIKCPLCSIIGSPHDIRVSGRQKFIVTLQSHHPGIPAFYYPEKMTTLFISDLHLTPARPETTAQFIDFMHGPARDADQLFILGDFFEYWIGDDAAELTGLGPILDELSGLTAAGVSVSFIAGNRDFLVGHGFTERTGADILPDESIIDLDGRPVLILHGDSLCTDDLSHQSFRNTVLNSEWQSDFLSRSIGERAELAKQARMMSAESTSGKPMEIMDVNRQAVINAMKEQQVDLLIHGHTHRPDIHRVDADDLQGARIVLGDWYDQASMLVFSGKEFELTARENTHNLRRSTHGWVIG
jgi:UDP-2,3-diacylglucosamine hydrolase